MLLVLYIQHVKQWKKEYCALVCKMEEMVQWATKEYALSLTKSRKTFIGWGELKCIMDWMLSPNSDMSGEFTAQTLAALLFLLHTGIHLGNIVTAEACERRSKAPTEISQRGRRLSRSQRNREDDCHQPPPHLRGPQPYTRQHTIQNEIDSALEQDMYLGLNFL